jgi:putative transposase
LIVEFIEEKKVEFGVEPIVTELKSAGVAIAQSTYYAARSRPPSKRAVSDAARAPERSRVSRSGRM